jgi:hypothetical protein
MEAGSSPGRPGQRLQPRRRARAPKLTLAPLLPALLPLPALTCEVHESRPRPAAAVRAAAPTAGRATGVPHRALRRAHSRARAASEAAGGPDPRLPRSAPTCPPALPKLVMQDTDLQVCVCDDLHAPMVSRTGRTTPCRGLSSGAGPCPSAQRAPRSSHRRSDSRAGSPCTAAGLKAPCRER